MHYSDFDLDGRAKVPVGFYLVILYLLRGYFIWVVSLTHREDPSLILSLVYNDSRTFLSVLTLGLPALMIYLLFLSKGRIASKIETPIWKSTKLILALTLLIDLGVQLGFIIHERFLVHWTASLALLIGVYLTWYWLSSKKVQRFIGHWLD